MLATHSPRQLVFDRGDVGEGAVIRLARRLRAYVRCGNYVQLMTQVIEGQQAIVKREDAVRHIEVPLRLVGKSFELPNHVVGEVTDAARGKRGQARYHCGTVLPQLLPQNIDYTAFTPPKRRTIADRDFVTSSRDHGPGLSSKKGVAPNLLATFHRLQQKGVFLPDSDA